MERNRAELQKLTERLIEAEAGLKASEVALYKAQAEWKSLQARLNALERDTLGNVAIQADDAAALASNTEKSEPTKCDNNANLEEEQKCPTTI